MARNKKNTMTAPAALRLANLEPEEHDTLLDGIVKLASNFGFKQILVPPVVERDQFFKNRHFENHFRDRALILNHEQGLALSPAPMYGTFKRFQRHIAVRGPHVVKWFYVQPVAEFASPKPIMRHEFGMFILGDASALAHAQLINSVNRVLSELGIPEFSLEVTSLGCSSCQKGYVSVLADSLGKLAANLCENCRTNLEQNPIAVWTCNNISCQTILANAPQMLDFLDESCRATFVGVLETLDSLGISYNLNTSLVGSYLSENIIFQANIAGAMPRQSLGEGGNYAAWTHDPPTDDKPAMLGFVTDLERLWQFVPEERRRTHGVAEVFLIPLGEVASRRVMNLQRDLQASGVTVAESMLGSAGIKNQLKEASDCKADIALIIGQKEALEDTVILRDIRSGMQELFASERIIEEVKKRLGK